MDSSTPPAVELRSASFAFPGAAEVLSEVDLRAVPGEHIAVIGRSGCGKSTLLSLIAGLAEPTAGKALAGGGSGVDERLAACALVPQGDSLLPWLSLEDNVALPLRNAGTGRRHARLRAREVLAEWGLSEQARSRPAALSGGMRQRGAVARALLAEKPILLADEPLGALDALTRADLQGWIARSLEASKRTLVLVTHDVEEALLLSSRVVVLAPRGEEGAAGPATVVAEQAGWFADFRGGTGRTELTADPAFARARAALTRRLSGCAEGAAA
ncbi:ABC transporter ATP-binding protein [Dietzia sp.]|uniref:ABC transporter ATP-binding protein n=1 Tax=Dietzia sp. TaxID=1871616 RepID=UPI002FDB549A